MNSVWNLNSEWTVGEKLPVAIFLVWNKKFLKQRLKFGRKIYEKKIMKLIVEEVKLSTLLGEDKKITFDFVGTFSNLGWSIPRSCCGRSPTSWRKMYPSSEITVLMSRTRSRRWSGRPTGKCTWTKRWTLWEVSKTISGLKDKVWKSVDNRVWVKARSQLTLWTFEAIASPVGTDNAFYC